MTINRVIIGADIVPTESNISFFCKGDIRPVVGEKMLSFLDNDCFLICNLETPLTNITSPIIKCGPSFITPEDAVNGLKGLGVDLVSLANNHIKDQGSQGIISTCKALSSANIHYVGVGENEKKASIPYLFNFCGKTIGVYSCAEHEFASAAINDYGANTFDALFSLDHIENLKKKCDFVIVLYHGGKEYYRFPSPELQKVCRRIVDKGADLVVCQHSHCIGAEERYKEGVIVYGQGNFIFSKKDNEYWNSSLLICIDHDFKISYIPIVRTDTGTRLADENEKEIILKDFQKRSKLTGNQEFIIEEYNRFANSLLYNYLAVISGNKSKFWYALNKLTKGFLTKILYSTRYPKRELAMLKNYIECEAHREAIITAISVVLDEKKN